MIKKMQKQLSKNMLLYTIAIIIAGIILGKLINLKFLSKLILPIVFLMIYPMMVNLSIASLKKIKKSKKTLIEAIVINFLFAPILMHLLTSIFSSGPEMTLALMLLSIAPASSMGLGYIGLAEGDMISGSIIVAVLFILSIFVYPIAGSYLTMGTSLNVPTSLIIKNLIIILVIPLILGIITREYIERNHGSDEFLKAKPYFSFTTMIFLYILIFTIFASKANIILQNMKVIFYLLPIAILYYSITTFLILILNKKVFNLKYTHHQAVVFTSVSKNIALTIAILVAVFGKKGEYLAVFPAVMSLFQAPFLMIYLKFSKKIKKIFEDNR